MYELKTTNKNNIFILFLIIILVVFFTIIAYTLFLDSQKYQYTQNLTAARLHYQNTNNITKEDIIESTLDSIVGISKIKDNGTTIFLEKSAENLKCYFGFSSIIRNSTSGFNALSEYLTTPKHPQEVKHIDEFYVS